MKHLSYPSVLLGALAVLFAVLPVAACRTFEPVSIDHAQAVLDPGDRVLVETRDGREIEFELVAVEEDELVGEDVRIPLAEVVHLEVSRVHQDLTVLAVGGVWLLVGLVGMAVFIATLSF